MDEAMVKWVVKKAIDQIRSDGLFSGDESEAAYALGRMPFIDSLRRLIDPTKDKPHLLRLIQDKAWWNRYLGTNLAKRLIGDPEIVGAVKEKWRQETHFHTQLAMIYLLLHSGLDESETRLMIRVLGGEDEKTAEERSRKKSELERCINQFYSGHPRGTWEALCLRLEDSHFEGAVPLHLLALALLAEGDSQRLCLGRTPPNLPLLLKHEKSQLVRELAERLARALRLEVS